MLEIKEEKLFISLSKFKNNLYKLDKVHTQIYTRYRMQND